MRPARVGIVGAGPAGATVALQLAKRGVEVDLFDPRAPWEKPCGGLLRPGLADMVEHMTGRPLKPRLSFSGVFHASPDGRESFVPFRYVTSINRKDLGKVLLESAIGSGVRFHPEKVLRIRREAKGWLLETRSGQTICELIVGADGFKSLVRRTVLGPLPAEYTATTVGYLVSGVRVDRCIFEYQDIVGYLWLIPRPQGVSVGAGVLGGRAMPNRLWSMVGNFLARRLPEARHLTKWAARIPLPSSSSFFDLPIQGEGWMLIGDAAGHVDPLAGEGIYYALQMGVTAAEAIAAGEPMSYGGSWMKGEGSVLRERATLFRRLFNFSRAFGGAAWGHAYYALSTRGSSPAAILTDAYKAGECT